MRKTVVGFVSSYRKAKDIVLDLEHMGIVGTEVEVVSRAENEVQNIGAAPTAVRPSKKSMGEKIAHLFRPHASHDQAMIIVRTADERSADRAGEVLRLHHAKGVTHQPGPTFVWENEQPESRMVKNSNEGK
jgi:hypothetical protein